MSFCKNCGTELPVNAQACPNCGTPAEQPQYQQQPVQPQYQEPQYAQPVQQYQQAEPVQATVAGELPTPKSILIMGIIGLAISCMPLGSIAGIIISALGMKKSNAYANGGGVPCGMSITGRILSRVGLIVSIVMTVFWAIWFTVVILAAATYHSSYTYHYYY